MMSAQNDTSSVVVLQFRPDLCCETVYSIQGLLLDGNTFCGLLKSYQFKKKNTILYIEEAKKKYPYYTFKKIKNFWDIEIYVLVTLNNQLLVTHKEKGELANYKQSDIEEIYSIGRLKAIRKYGWENGKKGALIIKTK